MPVASAIVPSTGVVVALSPPVVAPEPVAPAVTPSVPGPGPALSVGPEVGNSEVPNPETVTVATARPLADTSPSPPLLHAPTIAHALAQTINLRIGIPTSYPGA
jgi:hypothetical protein